MSTGCFVLWWTTTSAIESQITSIESQIKHHNSLCDQRYRMMYDTTNKQHSELMQSVRDIQVALMSASQEHREDTKTKKRNSC
jgi:hypothetical protein